MKHLKIELKILKVEHFKKIESECEQCEFTTTSKKGLKTNKKGKHSETI